MRAKSQLTSHLPRHVLCPDHSGKGLLPLKFIPKIRHPWVTRGPVCRKTRVRKRSRCSGKAHVFQPWLPKGKKWLDIQIPTCSASFPQSPTASWCSLSLAPPRYHMPSVPPCFGQAAPTTHQTSHWPDPVTAPPTSPPDGLESAPHHTHAPRAEDGAVTAEGLLHTRQDLRLLFEDD